MGGGLLWAIHHESAALFDDPLIQHAPFGIAVTDGVGTLLGANDAFRLMSGYALRDVITDVLTGLPEGGPLALGIWAHVQAYGFWEGCVQFRRPDGNMLNAWISLRVRNSGSGQSTCFWYVSDKPLWSAYQDATLQDPENADHMTGVLNHAAIERSLEAAVQTRILQGAVLFLDLDGFKQINVLFGYFWGDLVLREAAGRITRTFATQGIQATLGRISGDQFVVLIPEFQDVSDIGALAKQIVQAFREPFSVSREQFSLSISIGISLYPQDGQKPKVILRFADMAMYYTKQLGGDNYNFHAVQAVAEVRKNQERIMTQAISSDEFVVHYQPLYALQTMRICGVEALVRWSHPDHGLLMPSQFIRFAEETGLIVQIGEWIFRRVTSDIRAWMDDGLDVPAVSVNLSPIQFQHANLVNMIQDVLHEAGLSGPSLNVEITESAVLHGVHATVASLNVLRAFGIRVAIDDFGTGYSSLRYLSKMPVDTLKIDRSFISDMMVNPKNLAIVEAIIKLSHSMDIRVVAEGVEEQAQLDCLKRLECDAIQGYFVDHPMDRLALRQKLLAVQ